METLFLFSDDVALLHSSEMSDRDGNEWLLEAIPMYENLTSTVVSILESLLRANSIDFLTVSGRTKTIQSARDKILRKKYKESKNELTDLSGVRVILYFESQVRHVAMLLEKSNVDVENSNNRETLLSVDQIGYRSVHYVCDLGSGRELLPEYAHLSGLKFEIQLRTILQHAWAELAHDRNYKFSGKLPRAIERKIFLYAGMLEMADKGFDELSNEIDEYVQEIKTKTQSGDYDIELNSVSLEQFVQTWAIGANIDVEMQPDKEASAQMVVELREYGIHSIKDLKSIIPKDYAKEAGAIGYQTTISGLVRDWMILNDYERYRDRAWKQRWREIGDDFERVLYYKLVGKLKADEIYKVFELDDRRDDFHY